jgi:hypothetical protein
MKKKRLLLLSLCNGVCERMSLASLVDWRYWPWGVLKTYPVEKERVWVRGERERCER